MTYLDYSTTSPISLDALDAYNKTAKEYFGSVYASNAFGEEAKKLLDLIRSFLRKNLELELNHKSRYFLNEKGIDFCGYRIFETHILLRKRFKKKIKNKFKLWKKLIDNKKFIYTKFLYSVNSCKGHASHCNSYNFIKKFENDIDKLILDKVKKEG